jgi:type II secretory pathway pseudopilin PulG
MPRSKRSEQGFTLLAVIVAVTLLLIALAAAAPKMSTQIKHDREEELIHRAHQYTRAIQLFYRKFNRFPSSIEELENTNNVRFLRRRYPDPVTGKDEWRLIRFGQAKPKQLPSWQRGGAAKGGAGITAASNLGGQQQNQGQTTGGPSGAVNAADISKPLGSSNTLGVGGIVGVSSTSEKTGLKEIDGKKKYNEWEFVYDPSQDPFMRGVQNAAGGNVNPNGNRNTSGAPNGPTSPSQPSPAGPGGAQRPK